MKIWAGHSSTNRRFLTSYVGLLAVFASAGLPSFCLAGSEPAVQEQQQEKTAASTRKERGRGGSYRASQNTVTSQECKGTARRAPTLSRIVTILREAQ